MAERLPIRVRLTIASAGVLAAVLVLGGVVLFSAFRAYLDGAINSDLDGRVADAVRLVSASHRPQLALLRSGERLAQVYRADGHVLASTPRLGGARLLRPQQVPRAGHGGVGLEQVRTTAGVARVRALALRSATGQPLTVAVAEPLERRIEALERLRMLLLIAGPLGVLFATYAGYQVAGAALRPVERMRRRAELITDRDTAERLPVPATNDEIAALGHTLNELLARLDAALVRERRLLSDASHELRTPLTVLRTEVQLALRRGRSPEELREALVAVEHESDRLRQLAEDLLVVARADQGRLPIRSELLPARELLDAAARRATAAADAVSRSVTIARQTDLFVLADPDRAAQALDNLITNALLHGRGGVELAARQVDGWVELHVTDEGEGFPAGLVGHAFERFSRGDPARGGEGTGLGLAIVAAIARAHGGGAAARNHPGGADVWFSLPAGAQRTHGPLIPPPWTAPKSQ